MARPITEIENKEEYQKKIIVYDYDRSDENNQSLRFFYSKDYKTHPKIVSSFINQHMNRAKNITFIFASEEKEPKIKYSSESLVNPSMKLRDFSLVDETNEGIESKYLQQLFEEFNFEIVINLKFYKFKPHTFAGVCKATTMYFNKVKGLLIDSLDGELNSAILRSINMKDLVRILLIL